MKQLLFYSLILFFYLCLSSCKSSQHISKEHDGVFIEDFHPLAQKLTGDMKAVMLSENVDLRRESLRTLPWYINGTTGFKYSSSHYGWATTIVDKIILLTDNINNESFAFIDYFCPHTRMDLMTKCEMWLYSINKEDGMISKRKVEKKEIKRERLNDSICRVRLNIKESLSGKILVRNYSLIRPYYNTKQVGTSDEPTLAKIEPLTFQKDIPLLCGKYEIFLPDIDDVLKIPLKFQIIKSGNGELNINDEQQDVKFTYYFTSLDHKNDSRFYSTSTGSDVYKATKITITVSDVMPLSQDNDIQPLGVEFVTIQGEGIH